MLASKVYYFSETTKVYPSTDNVSQIEILTGACRTCKMTPFQLVNYVNSNYPSAQIPFEGVQVIAVTLFDVCKKKVAGTEVGFLKFAPSGQCSGKLQPDLLGSGWDIQFLFGKELVYKIPENTAEVLSQMNYLLAPNGNSYAYTFQSFGYIIGSRGFCETKKGYGKYNTSLNFNPDGTATVECYFPVTFTN